MNKTISNARLRLVKNLTLACAIFGFAVGASAEEKIVIRGSNTLGEELVPLLAGEYKKSHPNVAFDTEFKGTAYGIGAVLGGYCDLAGASRPVSKEQEEIAQIRGVHLKEYVIGSYTVSIVVNAANPVSNLSSNQVQSLFTGKVRNWKEVGGPDAPVHLVVRDPVSGTHLGFKELAMGYQDYGEHVTLFTNYAGIAELVAKDPSAIGYGGLASSAPTGTKIVSIEGVAPTAAAVNDHKYLYARTLRFYTNAESESSTTRDFLAFVLSPAGQQILTKMGDVPKGE